jgi:hypothetical protein
MDRKTLLLAAFVLAAACGGAQPGSTQDFVQNAPSYDQMALTESDVDPTPASAAPQDQLTQDATAPSCHPHLFVRTHEIVGRMNRHFAKWRRTPRWPTASRTPGRT